MLDKTPEPSTFRDIEYLIPWVWVSGLSMLAGFASFLQKVRTGHVRAWNFTEFVGEITAAGLTGIITANLCDSIGSPASLKYALVGISSHMGSRALFKLEALFNTKFNLPPDEPPATPPAGGANAA